MRQYCSVCVRLVQKPEDLVYLCHGVCLHVILFFFRLLVQSWAQTEEKIVN